MSVSEAKAGPPKMSVVTISFNQAQFLERAIRSVIEQKGVELDYVIVDPGSTDGSRDIIERYRKHFSVVILDKDNGPADGLNRGLAASTGEFFTYLNADDEFMPGALAEAAAVLRADPGLAAVYGNGYMIDEEGRRGRHFISSKWMGARLYAKGLAVIMQQSAFMRLDAIRAAGGFNVDNRTCWDGETFFDMALKGGRMKRTWRDWGLFRIYSTSITGSGSFAVQYAADCDRIFERFTGRPRTRLDRLGMRMAHAGLLLLDPRGSAAKVADRLRRRRARNA